MSDKKEMEAKRKSIAACCDIREENGKVIVYMEMPGVSKENLDIKVDNDKLIISGKKVFEQIKGEYKIREIRDGDYYHEFTIDDTIDRNKIDASIKNGALTLTLSTRESEKPRKITVEVK